MIPSFLPGLNKQETGVLKKKKVSSCERGDFMKVTMDQLARESGFSKATVSRALSDDPRVKEETKKKIQEIAARYNYQPHTIASSLARRKTKIVGLIFPDEPRKLSDPFFLEFLNGVSDQLFQSGYSMLIPQVKNGRINNTINQLVNHHRIDGVILTEPRLKDERLELLRQIGVPFVFLGSTIDEQVVWVDGDNIQGAYLVIDHLMKLGHERIGIITGETGLVATRNRVAGYRKALLDRGIEPEREWVITADFTEQGAYKVVKEYLATNESLPFTAIFASNDLMAIGAIKALKEVGYQVPKDVSVVGFDGIQLASCIEPALTTVQQPIYELGANVTQQLMKILEGQPVDEPHIMLPMKLIHPNSTTAPLEGHVNKSQGNLKIFR